MRRGVPTRLDVAGVRCRFGINTWRADEQRVRFTVLRDGELTGFDVRHGDHVDAVGREWEVTELQIPESGAVRLQLDEVPESA